MGHAHARMGTVELLPSDRPIHWPFSGCYRVASQAGHLGSQVHVVVGQLARYATVAAIIASRSVIGKKSYSGQCLNSNVSYGVNGE